MNNIFSKKLATRHVEPSIAADEGPPHTNTLLAKNQALTIALSQAIDEKVELQAKLILAHQK